MFCSLEYQYELRWVQQQAWPVQTPCGWSCVHQATPAEGRGLCKSAAWAKPAGGRTSPDWRSPPPAALICCDAAWTSPPVADQSSTTERSLKADQLHFHFIVLGQSYVFHFININIYIFKVNCCCVSRSLLYSELTCISTFCPDLSLPFLPFPAPSVSDPDPEENSPSSSFRTLRLVLSCCSWSLFSWCSFLLSVSLSLRCPRSPPEEVLYCDSSRPWLLSSSCCDPKRKLM